ncbi:universal stress protein [Oxalobacteraceae bacterium R-40]|uniref:Universal stress protein n=1 Tax=Keguizhuia sedimenti TaxID=3064264 RepID=A0ABU1BIX2_9BURK|nr:universal stress protein [Oxalobacteraceae bacterium R-40]
MKFLLAVDGSSYTVKAVEYVISRLDMFRDKPELHVLHVKLPIPTSEARAAAILGPGTVDNYYRTEAQEALAPAEAILKKKNIPYTASYCIGDIAEQINAYVKEHQIDMIIMGTHGHGALKSLVMGSVATKVLAITSVPVLLVR